MPYYGNKYARAVAANEPTPGYYDFQILSAEESTSKAGNPMWVLSLDIADARWPIKDWVVLSQEWKIKQLAESVGLLPRYEANALSATDLFGAKGKADFHLESDPDGKYKPRLKVKTYMPKDSQEPYSKEENYKSASEPPSYGVPVNEGYTPPPLTDDDIPF